MTLFTKAVKHSAKLRLALCGPSGSGKTYTALAIATGLGQRIAVIDTEHGSASRYADEFAFDVLELTNFHPDQYLKALAAAASEGYDVCIIDTLSHAWTGESGVLDLHDKAVKRDRSGNSFAAWREVTPVHNKLVEGLVQARTHLIVTMRTKTEYALQEERGKTVVKKLGLAPVQRDGIEYEFDMVGDLDLSHTLVISKTRIRCFDAAVIERPTADFGQALAQELAGGPRVRTVPDALADLKAVTDALGLPGDDVRLHLLATYEREKLQHLTVAEIDAMRLEYEAGQQQKDGTLDEAPLPHDAPPALEDTF